MMEYTRPMDIENRSMEIITELLGDRAIPPENLPVVKRVIHTTADFDYAENLAFSPGAVEKGIAALRAGCHIVTDTQMAKAGINKTALGKLGGEVHCFMSDPDVAEEAKARGVTRAVVSMERAAALDMPCVFAIGNAPTALVSLKSLMDAGKLSPALIVAVPVGFVNVVESKELILASPAPLHRGPGPQGRQQRGRRHLQRPALPDRPVRAGDLTRNIQNTCRPRGGIGGQLWYTLWAPAAAPRT